MRFFRLHCLPVSSGTVSANVAKFRMSAAIDNSLPAPLVEEVAIGSGPNYSPCYFKNPSQIFLKRCRFFMPYVKGSYPLVANSYLVTPSVNSNMIQVGCVDPLGNMVPQASRLQVRNYSDLSGSNAFLANDWIDINDAVRLPTWKTAMLLALNSTELQVIFDSAVSNFNISNSRFEIELYSSNESNH